MSYLQPLTIKFGYFYRGKFLSFLNGFWKISFRDGEIYHLLNCTSRYNVLIEIKLE